MGRYIDYLQYLDETVEYHSGQTIFRQGDAADRMYIVKTGAVMLKIDDKPIDLFRAGDVVGEMALVGNTVRCGAAKALTNCRLVVIDSNRFDMLLQESPLFVRELMEVMASRVRRMNKEILMLNRVLLRMNTMQVKRSIAGHHKIRRRPPEAMCS